MIADECDNWRRLDPIANPALTVRQVADVFGISPSSVYRMIEAETLPTVHVGGLKSTRVLTSDLLAFLKIDGAIFLKPRRLGRAGE